MHINHVAILVDDLEKMKNFYEKYFDTTHTELYRNQKTQFQSYFLSFESGARLELTKKPFIGCRAYDNLGFTHLALTVGNREDVDALVHKIVEDGYPLLNGPRITGDGYYEAVIQDPEGNLIELTTD